MGTSCTDLGGCDPLPAPQLCPSSFCTSPGLYSFSLLYPLPHPSSPPPSGLSLRVSSEIPSPTAHPKLKGVPHVDICSLSILFFPFTGIGKLFRWNLIFIYEIIC